MRESPQPFFRKANACGYAHRDMDANPRTIGELIEHSHRVSKRLSTAFYGKAWRTFSTGFKQRGEKAMTMELDDPSYMEVNKASSENPRHAIIRQTHRRGCLNPPLIAIM